MIGSEVLVFPEGGEGFLSTLRTTVLYSEKVRVLALVPPEAVTYSLDILRPITESAPYSTKRVEKYFSSVEASKSEIELLVREGLLLPILSGRASEASSIQPAADRLTEAILRARNDEATLGVLNAATPAFNSHLPCLADASYFAFLIEAFRKDRAKLKIVDELGHDLWLHLYFNRYLLQIAAASEQTGIPTCSWSQEFQEGMLAARRIYAGPSAHNEDIRSSGECVAFGLAHQILERWLPRADDLPLQELLRIRQKRADELESFRVAVRAAAVEINPEDTPERIRATTERLIVTRIDPALDDLRRALRTSRLDAFRGMGRSSASLAGAAVSASLTLATGGPVNLAALLAAAGGLVGSAIGSEIDRARIVRASQWGFLMRLRQRLRRPRS